MIDAASDIVPSTPRRIRPDQTWDAAREDYLAGASAEEVCRRHDLGLSAFRLRARQGEWRRIDQPAPDPRDDDLDLDAPRASRDSLLDKAWRRVSLALDTGCSTEAVRWMRVHAMLLAAERTEARDRDRSTAQEMLAPHPHRPRHRGPGHLHDAPRPGRQSQSQDPWPHAPSAHTALKKSAPASSTAPDPDDPGLTRAERRRRLKYLSRSP